MAWTAVVRTIVQGVIGMFLASNVGVAIVSWVENLGLTINVETITNAITLFLIGLVVFIVNTFGPKFAWINKIVSLGLSRTGPAYVPNEADAVVSVANKEAEDTIKPVDVPPPGPNDEGTPGTVI
jgi:hypothetical protein